jgi:hypothetical protein
MCSLCDEQTEDQYLDRIEGHIQDLGWAASGVDEGSPRGSWLYTIGLSHTFGVPELIMVGACTHCAHLQIADLVQGRIATGWTSDPPEETWARGRLGVVPVHPSHWTTDRFNVWHAHQARFPHDAPMRARQLLYADGAGILPTEPGVDPAVKRLQKRLDRATVPNREPAHHRARRRRRG